MLRRGRLVLKPAPASGSGHVARSLDGTVAVDSEEIINFHLIREGRGRHLNFNRSPVVRADRGGIHWLGFWRSPSAASSALPRTVKEEYAPGFNHRLRWGSNESIACTVRNGAPDCKILKQGKPDNQLKPAELSPGEVFFVSPLTVFH